MFDMPPAQSDAAVVKRRPQKRRVRNDINGWLILDKPVGLTSNEALGALKRLFRPAKAGHAGTLDPLASGILPIALGDATKTVPFVVDGRKVYRFTVRWGAGTDTDDAEGETLHRSDARPSAAAIRDVLPEYTGEIMQVPPRYSAVKIKGERAYDLARNGEAVELAARPVVVHRLALIDAPDDDHAVFEAECGKGTYVRSLARDMAVRLGTHGHVSALRRQVVGPFDEADAVELERLEEMVAADAEAALASALHPVQAGLFDLPHVDLDKPNAVRLRRGQAIILRGEAAHCGGGLVCAMNGSELVALGEVEKGQLHPTRVFKPNPQRRIPAE